MVFNTTFYNISTILWRTVLLMEETGVSGEINRHVVSHIMLIVESGVKHHNFNPKIYNEKTKRKFPIHKIHDI
jgi:predicted component of viral defense system (DUF524 family)